MSEGLHLQKKYTVTPEKVNIIRSARWLKGIRTDGELAQLVGVGPEYFSTVMCGHRESKALMQRIAKVLDIPESDLLDDPQPQEATPDAE